MPVKGIICPPRMRIWGGLILLEDSWHYNKPPFRTRYFINPPRRWWRFRARIATWAGRVGEARREQVQHSIENARVLIDQSYNTLELTWGGAQIQSRKYLPFAEERYPQYVDEMRGIAEGANVSFDDVVTLNTMEAVTMDALHLTRCTSFAVNEQRAADGHVLAAHNEDWVPEDENDVCVILAKPKEEPPFLAMTYGGLLPNVGFNAYGIAQFIDSVYPNDSRIGIPRLVVARAVLSSRRISGAIGRTAHLAARRRLQPLAPS
jgi:hypothetical protein